MKLVITIKNTSHLKTESTKHNGTYDHVNSTVGPRSSARRIEKLAHTNLSSQKTRRAQKRVYSKRFPGCDGNNAWSWVISDRASRRLERKAFARTRPFAESIPKELVGHGRGNKNTTRLFLGGKLRFRATLIQPRVVWSMGGSCSCRMLPPFVRLWWRWSEFPF